MIAAVFFDLYETLITEFEPSRRPRPSVAQQLGIAREAFDSEWRARRERRMCGMLPDYPATLREIRQAVGRQPNEEMIRQLHAERLAAKAAPFARVDAEVEEALRHLRRLDLKLGLISNCAREEVAAWEGCPLAAYFRDAVFSYQAGQAKPDRAIYRLAARRLGVAPGRALFVGDGGSDELAGAASAGMTPYWATWFLRHWPAWKRPGAERARAAAYPEVRTPAAPVAVMDDGSRQATPPQANSARAKPVGVRPS